MLIMNDNMLIVNDNKSEINKKKSFLLNFYCIKIKKVEVFCLV